MALPDYSVANYLVASNCTVVGTWTSQKRAILLATLALDTMLGIQIGTIRSK